jgi:hypothetical protein
MQEIMERGQNIVRLLDTKSKTKKASGASADENRAKTIKLAIRFLTGLNGPLRSQTQYRGDLSQIVMDALLQVDLGNVALIDIREPKEEETCLMLSEDSMKALKKASKQREVSLNVLVNTAVAHWLAEKKSIKLKG